MTRHTRGGKHTHTRKKTQKKIGRTRDQARERKKNNPIQPTPIGTIPKNQPTRTKKVKTKPNQIKPDTMYVRTVPCFSAMPSAPPPPPPSAFPSQKSQAATQWPPRSAPAWIPPSPCWLGWSPGIRPAASGAARTARDVAMGVCSIGGCCWLVWTVGWSIVRLLGGLVRV